MNAVMRGVAVGWQPTQFALVRIDGGTSVASPSPFALRFAQGTATCGEVKCLKHRHSNGADANAH